MRANEIIARMAGSYGAKKGPRALKGTRVAEWTGLEPATPGVTGRYSNQLNYHSKTGGC